MILASFLLTACSTSGVITEKTPPLPLVPADLLVKPTSAPTLDDQRVTMGKLVIYVGDVLDHDRELQDQLTSLIEAVSVIDK